MSHQHHVVLVRPHYARNVGSTSRAMANMGAGRLILIAPECELGLEARQGAAGAQQHLAEATTYASLTEFFATEPDGLRLAFAAREKKDTDEISFEDRVRLLYKEGDLVSNNDTASARPVYLFFGPEDHGLERQDLEYAHFICQLPVYGHFTSYNLSQAVLLALYIIKHNGPISTQEPPIVEQISLKADVEDKFYFPDLALQEWLTTLGFEIGERRSDAYTILRRILLNNKATTKELRILAAIVNQTVRKLK